MIIFHPDPDSKIGLAKQIVFSINEREWLDKEKVVEVYISLSLYKQFDIDEDRLHQAVIKEIGQEIMVESSGFLNNGNILLVSKSDVEIEP